MPLSSTSDWSQQFLDQMAAACAKAGGAAISTLLSAFGASTEPSFPAIANTYDRMLAISLLVLGAFISCALIEQILGGSQGAGWSVVPRTMVAVAAASCGLGVVQYLNGYAALVAGMWAPDFANLQQLLAQIADHYSQSYGYQSFPLGSSLGLLAVAVFTVLMSLLVYMELFARVALILIVTSFIPLVAAMWVWPRLAGAATHLAEFLVGLLLSKFVIATSIYVGYSLLLPGLTGQPSPGAEAGWMIAGIAILVIAAFSPVVLVQGLRFTHSTAGSVARGLGMGALTLAPVASGPRVATSALGGLKRSLRRRRPPAAGRTDTPKEVAE